MLRGPRRLEEACYPSIRSSFSGGKCWTDVSRVMGAGGSLVLPARRECCPSRRFAGGPHRVRGWCGLKGARPQVSGQGGNPLRERWPWRPCCPQGAGWARSLNRVPLRAREEGSRQVGSGHFSRGWGSRTQGAAELLEQRGPSGTPEPAGWLARPRSPVALCPCGRRTRVHYLIIS